jgi:hypothetical protein
MGDVLTVTTLGKKKSTDTLHQLIEKGILDGSVLKN